MERDKLSHLLNTVVSLAAGATIAIAALAACHYEERSLNRILHDVYDCSAAEKRALRRFIEDTHRSLD